MEQQTVQQPSCNSRVVVLPVDASKNSEKAFEWYCTNIHRPEDELVLVHVTEAPFTQLPTDGASEEEFKKLMSSEEKKVNELKAKYESKASSASIKYCWLTVCGKPGEAIVKCANEKQADFVLMGCRGLGAIRRTIMGSVSDYVLHHSHVPVIIIPNA